MQQVSLQPTAFTGHVVESFPTESCDADVEDVLVDELEGLVDNLGTTMGTSPSVALYYPSVFNQMWFVSTGPLKGISMIFAEFPKR